LTKVNFHYDWIPTSADVPILVGQDKGWFADAGIDLVVSPGSPQVNCLTLVAAGNQDICISPAVGVLTAHDTTNPPVTAVGMIQVKDPYGLTVDPTKGVTKPKDLEGKSVGVHPQDPQYAIWKAFEAAQSLDTSTITEVPVSFSPDPLFAGQVVAIPNFLTLEPYQVAQHYNVGSVPTFLFADFGAKAAGQTIIANNQFTKDHPELVTAFLGVYARGLDWALNNVDDAEALITKTYPDLQPTVAQELPALQKYWTSDDTKKNGLLWQSSDLWQSTATMLKQYGFLTKDVAPADVMTNDFLPSDLPKD